MGVISETPSRAEPGARVTLSGFARLAAAGERTLFAKGSDLIRQGDEATCIFVILTGSVQVVRDHPDLSAPIVLASLGPGEIVGEMGLLDGEPRSATVTALEDTLVVEVGREAVATVTSQAPDLYADLARLLSKRLRATNELAADAVGQGKRDT